MDLCILCQKLIKIKDNDNNIIIFNEKYCFECHLAIKLSKFEFKENNYSPIKCKKNMIFKVNINDFILEEILIYLYNEKDDYNKIYSNGININGNKYNFNKYNYIIINMNKINRNYQNIEFKICKELENSYIFIYNCRKINNQSRIVKYYAYILYNLKKFINFKEISLFKSKNKYKINLDKFKYFPTLPVYNTACSDIHINNFSYFFKYYKDDKVSSFNCIICDKNLDFNNFYVVEDIHFYLNKILSHKKNYDEYLLIYNNYNLDIIHEDDYEKEKSIITISDDILIIEKNNDVNNYYKSNVYNEKNTHLNKEVNKKVNNEIIDIKVSKEVKKYNQGIEISDIKKNKDDFEYFKNKLHEDELNKNNQILIENSISKLNLDFSKNFNDYNFDMNIYNNDLYLSKIDVNLIIENFPKYFKKYSPDINNIDEFFYEIFLILTKKLNITDIFKYLITISLNFAKYFNNINNVNLFFNQLYFILKLCEYYNNEYFLFQLILFIILNNKCYILNYFDNILKLIDNYKIINIFNFYYLDKFSIGFTGIKFIEYIKKNGFNKLGKEFFKILKF